MFYAFKTFQNFFGYIRMEILNYKKENIERKYLENMQNIQFLKIKKTFRIRKRFYGTER